MKNCQNLKGEMKKTYNVYKTYDGGNTKYSLTEDYNHSWTEELSGLEEGDKFYVVTGEYNGDWDFDVTLYNKPDDEDIKEFFKEMCERVEEMYADYNPDNYYDGDYYTKEERIQQDFQEYCRITVDEYEIDPSATVDGYGPAIEEGIVICSTEYHIPSDFCENFCLNTYSKENRDMIKEMFGFEYDERPTKYTEVTTSIFDDNDKETILSKRKYDGNVADIELDRIVEELRKQYDTKKVDVFVTTDYYYADNTEKFHTTYIL